MKNIFDNKLQELLGDKTSDRYSELSLQEREDFKVYEKLINILDSEPSPKIPLDFSTKVMGVIQKRRDRKQTFILYFLFTLLVLPAVSLFMFFINNQVVRQFADVLIQYRWIFVFCIFSILIIQFADKKLVSKIGL
jgi:hypothetical protein